MPIATFSLSTRTQLSASPQLQQAMHLLHLSALDFTQEMKQALETNPFLEDLELADDAAAASEDESDDASDSTTEAEETAQVEAEYEDGPVASDPIESMNPFESTPADTRNSASSAGGDACDWAHAETSLRDHLRAQVCGCGVSERECLAAAVVVDTLDDDGYLRGNVQESASAAGVDPPLTAEEIDAGIRFVQSLDPSGVGARDLAECLALQLEALDAQTPGRDLALPLVRDHLGSLARRDFAELRRALDCDDDALRTAHALIRRLDPKPGHRYSAPPPQFVVPDVIVQHRGGKLVTVLNPAVRPGARLNRSYVEWFRRARDRGHPALTQQLQEARWLLHNVEQRFATIQRVAEAIVARQRAFFSYGEIAMRPLVLREVADDLGLHESTISRATGNKYMETPRGLFEFKHFFSRSLATQAGGACSAAAVRALMTEMISAEQVNDPLSDVSLARMLSQQGIRVARRTVTKYRRLMKVPPAELRRHA